MTALVVHGHFYQPPRENPWTGAVEREPSAAPFRDWNERILAECYRSNAFARIVDHYGRVSRIANNYANISFNFGPTLLSWIEARHPHVYRRILDADRESRARHNGHGNAIAQAYNHVILPLANGRDRKTQIEWGLADFRHRFKREPESMWLPETACNQATLDDLIDAGLAYVILSPYQAERVRTPGGAWVDVSDGSVDPGVAYRYLHQDGSGRSIAIFFYDAPIARAIAFEGGLSSSQALVDLLSRAHGGEGRIVQTATDGESYGHHAHFGDRSLAYALDVEAPARGFWVTNYGEYLERHPPTLEVEIKSGPDGEGTAWSCAHGVGRWCRDCGCHTGGQKGWNQQWRGPLRAALDQLRDFAANVFERDGSELLIDPWAARNGYIDLFLDRKLHPEDFLRSHATKHLRANDRVRALTFLELQRNAQLMYTSCGWFFNDVSGIETLQILKYAGRAIGFAEELGYASPEEEFLELLSEAESNIPEFGNGADIYRRFVERSRFTRRGITAHLAFSSLVAAVEPRGETCDYSYQISSFRKEKLGRLTLATGRAYLESIRTGKQLDAVFAAVHFGGVDFYCLVRPFPGADRLRKATSRLWKSFRSDSLPRLLRIAQEEFGPDEYGLEHVLPEGRQSISEIVFGNLIQHFSEQYAHLYEDHHRTLEMLQSAGFEIPPELRVAAEFTLGKRLEDAIRRQNRSRQPTDYKRALSIAGEIEQRGYEVDRSFAREVFAGMIAEAVETLVEKPTSEHVVEALDVIELAKTLCGEAPIERAQEIAYDARDRLPDSPERDRLIESLWLAPVRDAVEVDGTPESPVAPGA